MDIKLIHEATRDCRVALRRAWGLTADAGAKAAITELDNRLAQVDNCAADGRIQRAINILGIIQAEMDRAGI